MLMDWLRKEREAWIIWFGLVCAVCGIAAMLGQAVIFLQHVARWILG